MRSRIIIQKKKISHYLFLVIFIMILVLATHLTSASKKPSDIKTSKEVTPQISTTIKDAFYGDADGDGNVDDIIVYIQHNFCGVARYQLDVYPTLVLPSGKYYRWHYGLNTGLKTVTLIAYFLNQALESGNYTIFIDVFLKTGGITHSQTSYEFDPPGGKGDNPPDFDVVLA